jgi:hypothetical protein
MEISVRVDGGVGWKDEYAMGWCGLLAKGCTICTPDGARHGRTRIGAFHFTLPFERVHIKLASFLSKLILSLSSLQKIMIMR